MRQSSAFSDGKCDKKVFIFSQSKSRHANSSQFLELFHDVKYRKFSNRANYLTIFSKTLIICLFYFMFVSLGKVTVSPL